MKPGIAKSKLLFLIKIYKPKLTQPTNTTTHILKILPSLVGYYQFLVEVDDFYISTFIRIFNVKFLEDQPCKLISNGQTDQPHKPLPFAKIHMLILCKNIDLYNKI